MRLDEIGLLRAGRRAQTRSNDVLTDVVSPKLRTQRVNLVLSRFPRELARWRDKEREADLDIVPTIYQPMVCFQNLGHSGQNPTSLITNIRHVVIGITLLIMPSENIS